MWFYASVGEVGSGGGVFACCLVFSCLVLVGEVFDGVLVYAFHKIFNVRFWDF